MVPDSRQPWSAGSTRCSMSTEALPDRRTQIGEPAHVGAEHLRQSLLKSSVDAGPLAALSSTV
jgi:hypothetical protein